MDATANLNEQLAIANNLIGMSGNHDSNSLVDVAIRNQKLVYADRLAELVLTLNGWISHGGCLPEQWAKKGFSSGGTIQKDDDTFPTVLYPGSEY